MVTENKKKTVKKTTKKIGYSIPVYDLTGKTEKDYLLPENIFSVKVSPKLLSQSVRVYLTNQRQGNASTKTRGDVTGSTRKIYRQKGTGRARHGDIKAPIFVGGGVVGGPKPKNYALKFNKKQKRKSLLGALNLKKEKNNLVVLNDRFLKIEPKTKILINFFNKMNLNKGKKLIVIPNEEKRNLSLAARNISNVEVVELRSLNAYQILSSQKILILAKAIDMLTKNNK